MLFRPYRGTRKDIDLITGITPIFRIDSRQQPHLIGTGFWVTEIGHLVTAWHVVQDNIDENGRDLGPIFAIQTFSDKSTAVRIFSKSDRHLLLDLALSETFPVPPYENRPTTPIHMSLDELITDEPVFSFAVLSIDQHYDDENPGFTSHRFHGDLVQDGITIPLMFAVRVSFGSVTKIFEEMRDRIMLPFPCIQTNVPIYGGNSGGPLLDIRGRIRAVNCTSFGGHEISFHVPILGVLELQVSRRLFNTGNTDQKSISVLELAAMQRIPFDAPVLDGNKWLISTFRLIRYFMKCLIRWERPSDIHIARRPSD